MGSGARVGEVATGAEDMKITYITSPCGLRRIMIAVAVVCDGFLPRPPHPRHLRPLLEFRNRGRIT